MDITKSTPRRRWLAGVALLAALALTGCAAGQQAGVASLDDGTESTQEPDAASSERGDPVKFAECMREQGIEIEDPEASDRFSVAIPPETDPEDAMRAQEECKEFLPDGGDRPEADPEMLAGAREFAKCMRENGIEDFPDPDSSGAMVIERGRFDPEDPEFKAAREACAGSLPGLEQSGEGPDGGE